MDDATTPVPPSDPAERAELERARPIGTVATERYIRSRRRGRGRIAGKLLVSALAALVVAGTAIGWAAENGFDDGFLRSSALGDDAPRSLDGDLNILLIGLDTRKDRDGKDLPAEILDQLHAGDGEEGGYNANTLILVHIPADLSKITAISIPRDDYVTVTGIPGYTKAKIKETYGLKKAVVQQQAEARGETDRVKLEHLGREAGRASVIQHVRALTGVPIDLFAEITLSGFYDLAAALNGVEVCLNNPVQDPDFSGADFPAGRQRLDPAQALAFVRQRHGLENGDLDRTHRQQAFLTSVARELREAGTFTDVGKLTALMDVAHRNVVLSDDWDVIDFLRTVGSADSPAVEFRTLPVVRYDFINGQDVNIVDPAAIRREVRTAFGDEESIATTTALPSAPSVVDVADGGAGRGVAAALSSALATAGFRRGTLVDSPTIEQSGSSVLYAPGRRAEAERLAETLGGLPVRASTTIGPGRIEVVLGAEFVMPPALTAASATASVTRSAATTTSGLPSRTGSPTPDVGAPIDADITGDGTIPCVN
ncbi:LCP family protein [Nocardia takedensis]